MIRHAALSLVLASVTVACGRPASEPIADGPATLKGSVALTSYAGALDNPVVVARTLGGASYVAPVTREGKFRLTLPSTEHYRVLLASTLRDGTYRLVSEITWGPQKASWGSFPKSGMSIDVGTVHRAGSASLRTQSSGSGDGSDCGCDDDDDSSGSGSGSGSSGGGDDEASSSDCYKPGEADLPYDARPGVGQTWKLLDAFLEKGPPPKAVLDVTMEGDPWRLAELRAGTAFTITQADCDHVGNKDIGRDRIFVTWENADGSTETDHLDMRYCKDGGGTTTPTTTAAPATTGECKGDEAPVCSGGANGASECDGGSMKPEDHPSDPLPSCPSDGGDAATGSDGSNTATSPSDPSGGAGGSGGACVTSTDCASGLACYSSVCNEVVH